MSAVVRVKRRMDEEPLSGFVLNCKKQKIGDSTQEHPSDSKDEITTVLKFAGTVESQEEHVGAQINRLTKEEAKEIAKKTRQANNLTERFRDEMRHNSHENRFKIVNCYRTANEEAENPKQLTIVDIEKQPDKDSIADINIPAVAAAVQASSSSSSSPTALLNQSNPNMAATINDNYVYDLYLPDTDQPAENVQILENYNLNNISVRPCDDFTFDDRYRDSESSSHSTDSNCEDHYANDYPDTDESINENSVGEDDIRNAVANMDLANSSEDENGFVYAVDAENIGFEDEIDYCDVNRYYNSDSCEDYSSD